MKNSIRLLGGSIGGALALFAVSCTQSDTANPSAPDQPAITAPAARNLGAKPIAAVDLKDGHAVEFYDFGEDVLISETGKAGTSHYFTADNQPSALIKNGVAPDQVLSQVWSAISPGSAVPKPLLDIQARWKAAPPPTNAARTPDFSHEASGTPFGQSLEIPQPLAKAAAPVGCNNGCCDFQWLSTFSQCGSNFDYHWFLYNYGWSYANSGDVDYYSGMACSASGTSTFKVNMSDGTGGTWSVPQATYRTFYWSSGFWGFNRTLTSSVNTSSNQHLHTYCGGLNH
jgi:hypothetical protein